MLKNRYSSKGKISNSNQSYSKNPKTYQKEMDHYREKERTLNKALDPVKQKDLQKDKDTGKNQKQETTSTQLESLR